MYYKTPDIFTLITTVNASLWRKTLKEVREHHHRSSNVFTLTKSQTKCYKLSNKSLKLRKSLNISYKIQIIYLIVKMKQ